MMVELACDFRRAKVNPYWPNIIEGRTVYITGDYAHCHDDK